MLVPIQAKPVRITWSKRKVRDRELPTHRLGVYRTAHPRFAYSHLWQLDSQKSGFASLKLMLGYGTQRIRVNRQCRKSCIKSQYTHLLPDAMRSVDHGPYPFLPGDAHHFLPGHERTRVRGDRVEDCDDLVAPRSRILGISGRERRDVRELRVRMLLLELAQLGAEDV